MSGNGDPYDNAVAENFFSCLKCELVHHKHYRTRAEAQADIFSYIEAYYNAVRPQSALNWLSPLAYEHLLSIHGRCVAWQWRADMIGLCWGELPLGLLRSFAGISCRQSSPASKPWNKCDYFYKNKRIITIHSVFCSFLLSVFSWRAQFLISFIEQATIKSKNPNPAQFVPGSDFVIRISK